MCMNKNNAQTGIFFDINIFFCYYAVTDLSNFFLSFTTCIISLIFDYFADVK